MRRLIIASLFISIASSVHAQVTVEDPAAIVQLVIIIEKVEATIRLMKEEYTTIQTMRRGLTGLDRFRVPGVPIGTHDLGKYPYGRDILAGLNNGGDPDGNGWQRTVQKLQIPGVLFDNLGAAAKRVLMSNYAQIEVTDSTAILAGWTAGGAREYHAKLQGLITQLERDVVSGVSEPNANLDKLAVASVIRSRQSMSQAQLQSATVNLLISQQLNKRNADAETVNMQLRELEDDGKLMRSLTGGR